MEIVKKSLGSRTMRIPVKMWKALGPEVTLIQIGETVVIVKGAHIKKETIESLRMVIDMFALASKLEKEEMDTEMKEVLRG